MGTSIAEVDVKYNSNKLINVMDVSNMSDNSVVCRLVTAHTAFASSLIIQVVIEFVSVAYIFRGKDCVANYLHVFINILVADEFVAADAKEFSCFSFFSDRFHPQRSYDFFWLFEGSRTAQYIDNSLASRQPRCHHRRAVITVGSVPASTNDFFFDVIFDKQIAAVSAKLARQKDVND